MQLFSPQMMQLKTQALSLAAPYFTAADEIAENNTYRILSAFREYKLSEFHFKNSTGYAYDDAGRDKLEQVWANVFQAEKALVRTQFVSGTHALASVLFGILRPGDELIAATGAPYDTMQTVIGYPEKTPGCLTDFGVTYKEIPMEYYPDIDAICQAISAKTKMVLIQRSRGYSMRKTLTIKDIEEICRAVHNKKPDCVCFVDNCYGEFTEIQEPTAVGADIAAGSLIKNPGGGIAPTGGYVAGRSDLVDLVSYRLTAPGIGSEVGASLTGNRLLYQGLFLAPHVVAQSIKGSLFASALFHLLGYKTLPELQDVRSDIIQAIQLGSPEKMVAFCRGLQKFSPVDSHVLPEPSGMPGYSDAIVMAGGTFIQGSSIELSADGPLRSPYSVYLQGGLTLEHAIIGILGAADAVIALENNHK